MKTACAIREASREDAEAIATMYEETWPVHWHTADLVRMQFDILDPIDGRALVAVVGDRVVGHIEFIPTREPPPYGYWGYMEAIEVHRELYRQGIGTALVREAIRRCEALGCSRFGTSPDDERSEGLYRKCGMSQAERRLAVHFAIVDPPDAPAPDSVEDIPPAERPWEQLLHVLGRSHCPAYWWSMTMRRKEAGWNSVAGAFAVRLHLGGREAAVLYTGHWLHLLVPPAHATDGALVRAAVAYAVGRLKELEKESFHTLMPLELADAVRSAPGLYQSDSHFDDHMWMPLGQASS